MEFINPEQSWKIFQLCQMFDWRFLPSQILAEPEWLLSDIVQFMSLKSIMEKQDRARGER